ncbi:thiamine pyrophosphokinase [Clostridium argentinense CDC 2741]|uniref:Thiamine diphosphokinase n=1 Tax=Clostridium argentinense CDC 2741 TaxID=1418104 RepID=A0A0C1RAR3_9CLOT|nr:thiamine diphosphokinase [Clostridium argentinense]ARC84674.1 thiamine pyrophosphokinase [Clostridium argentinense]KIE47501.1 thiamine pyrophosphokinase [Clostridium argentinense CDC 2741]NFF40183.1 thiamine diphosphokinase [Clostridium argentinense]NFP50615.1 thiamine diphosphokinase [Clostridium argentinense]NFP72437.1 thiamine diphosphokinase [Clostridium argentinense]
MKIAIVSGGKAPSEEILNIYIEKGYEIIAADSGANCLYKYRITPKILLGDFDSIDKEVLNYFKDKTEILTVPSEKDFTDTELALNMAIDLKAKDIVFLGCTGSRMDHFLGNLCVLYKALEKNIKASIVDENNSITMINTPTIIRGKKGECFSLIAFKEDVKNLTIKGAKYELNSYYLSLSDNLTLSNEFIEEEVSLVFDSGTVILMRCID